MSVENGRLNGGQNQSHQGPRFTKNQLRREILSATHPIDGDSDSLLSRLAPAEQNHAEKEIVRSIRPCGLIGVGGGGAQSVRRTKKQLSEQRTHKFVVIRTFDTDPTAQTNTDLTDKQFCQVRTNGTMNALENPEGHESLVNRFDLNDPLVRNTSEALHKTDQAGQVRFQGCHALLSDFDSVRASLSEMIQELNGTLVRLEKQLEAKNSVRIRDRMKIYIVSSLCGGTGSSMLLQLCAMLRQLAEGIELDIVPICIASSAFEKELRNRPEQWKRVQANQYAGMQELGAFMEGFGTRYAVNLGPDESHHCKLDSGFANEIFVVGRTTADGRDLGSDKAVYDTVATYLAADIGTEISDQLEMDDANQCTLKGLSVDPATGRPRYLATLGAVALSLDIVRTANYCSYSAISDLLASEAIGKCGDSKLLNQVIDGWLANPTDNDKPAIPIASIAESLKRSSIPNIKGTLAKVYRGQSGRNLLHYRDLVFVTQINAILGDLTNQATPKLQEQLAKCETALTKSLCESLVRLIQDRVATHGLAEGLALASEMRQRLQKIAATARRTEESEMKKASDISSRVLEKLGHMSKRWFRYITKSKTLQIQLVTDAGASFHMQCSARIHQTFARIMTQLNSTVGKLDDQIQSAIRQASILQDKLLKRKNEYRAGLQVTTVSSYAEIDIGSRHTDQQLYQRFCPPLEKLGPKFARDRWNWYLDLCKEGESLQHLRTKLQSSFEQKLDLVDIVEILVDQLVDKETNSEVSAKIRQSMLSAQPTWTANARNNSVQFADALIVGIPECVSDAKRKILIDEMMAAASSRVNANGQYRGSAKFVLAGDKHKIYIIRRTHGACWHYLPEVRSCQEAYEKWMQSGGHPVHIFNKKLVAKMPSLVPLPKLAAEDAVMALGLAFGFVAKRGPRLYWNALESPDASIRCPLASHWPTVESLISASDTHDSSKSVLGRLTHSGKLRYERGDAIDESFLLGESWSEAASTLADHPQRVKQGLGIVDTIRAMGGDDRIANDLDEYIDNLRSTAVKTQGMNGLVDKVACIIARKTSELR